MTESGLASLTYGISKYSQGPNGINLHNTECNNHREF